jgi:hypothetical protein
MIEELNARKPEFVVKDGAIRLLKVKVFSDGKETFFAKRGDRSLNKFLKSNADAIVEDFPQEEYLGAEGLTGDMLEYNSDEETLNFEQCSHERLEMVIQKRCMRSERSHIQSVDPLYEEFLREERLAEFQKACQNAIYEGVEVETSEGTKRFSLTMADQMNLMNMRSLLDKGVPEIPYHADGEPMKLWSGSDIQKILQAADRHITHHRVYFSLLREWMRRTGYPDFLRIDYGSALPDDLALNMTEVCARCTSIANAG